jgi:hypothetical protein
MSLPLGPDTSGRTTQIFLDASPVLVSLQEQIPSRVGTAYPSPLLLDLISLGKGKELRGVFWRLVLHAWVYEPTGTKKTCQEDLDGYR